MHPEKLLGETLLLVLLGCATPPSPDRVGDDMARQPVVVMEFEMEGASIDHGAPRDGLGLALAEELATRLRELGYEAHTASRGDDVGTTLVVSGRVLKVDAGIGALRHVGGLGAGTASFEAAGAIYRVDGPVIASFRRERDSSWGGFGDSPSTLVQQCLRSVADDIAELVTTVPYEN